MVIAGSGARVVPLFAKTPDNLTCIDMSQEQLYLTEMRIESLRQLTYEEYCILLGYLNSNPAKRKLIFERIDFSQPAKQFMSTYFKSINWESLLFSGKWESDLARSTTLFQTILPDIQQQINDCQTLKQQQKVFRDIKPKLKLIKRLLFLSILILTIKQKTLLRKTHLTFTGIFHLMRMFDRSMEQVFRTLLIKESFYYSILFTGQYSACSAPTAEINQKHFENYKHGAQQCNIQYVQQDVFEYCENCSDSFDFLSFSNVPDYLRGNDKKGFFERLQRAIKSQGILTYRRSVTDNMLLQNSYVREISDKYQNIINNDTTPYYKTFVYEF